MFLSWIMVKLGNKDFWKNIFVVYLFWKFKNFNSALNKSLFHSSILILFERFVLLSLMYNRYYILSVTKLFARFLRAELTSNCYHNNWKSYFWWNLMKLEKWRSEINQKRKKLFQNTKRKNIIKFNRSEQFNSKFMGTVKRILHWHIHFNCFFIVINIILI